MFLFNLSFAEFLGLFAAASGIVTALYLLDRSRKKHRVSTLRFWTHSETPSEMQHRRRIQQPWSLLLQLLSVLCLLLALAQLRWGSSIDASRDHVLVLDVSAVMDVRTQNQRWFDQARTAAAAWLRAVPPGDRVMLVRADALATAATAFESNHAIVAQSLAQSSPGALALDLDQALRFATQAQRLQGKRGGEIVYAGAGRSAAEDTGFAGALPNLRVLPVRGEMSNAGLRKISVRRAPSANSWEAFVTVGNDSAAPRVVPVAMLFGKSVIAQRRLTIPPGGEQSFSTEFITDAAGVVETRIQVNDDFEADNYAALELPEQTPLKVRVYTDRPSELRPLFSASRRVSAEYVSPSGYRPEDDSAVVVLDRFGAAPPTRAAAIWIDPPANASPVAVVSSKGAAVITQWHNEHALGMGLRAPDIRLPRVSVFEPKPGDIPVASVQGGPVILARPSSRAVVLGFHPMESALKYELATPLLFANILRWIAPEVFLRYEMGAMAAGGVTAKLDFAPDPKTFRVTMDGVGALPFTLEDQTLRFFSGVPGIARAGDGRHEMVYSMTLPEVTATVWTPPANARVGVPGSLGGGPVARDLWQWLALLGGVGLLAEWWIYGRARRRFRLAATQPAPKLRKAS
jgi:hypothetical protein